MIVQLNLSKGQSSKLRNGHPIQVKFNQMGDGDEYDVSDAIYERLAKAYNSGKGCRVQMPKSKSGGSLKTFGRQVKKTFEDPNLGRKVANTSRKIANTTRKIKNSVGKFEFIGDMGIPYVSEGYDALKMATEAVDAVAKNSNEAIQDGYKTQQEIRELRGVAKNANEVRGGSINPYLPKNLMARKSGGSFRPMGGSFKVIGSGLKPETTETNILNHKNPGFIAMKPKPLMGNGVKCKCCGK